MASALPISINVKSDVDYEIPIESPPFSKELSNKAPQLVAAGENAAPY